MDFTAAHLNDDEEEEEEEEDCFYNYSAVLRSRADALRSHVILHE